MQEIGTQDACEIEPKELKLLSSLHLFEVSIIARFLSAKEKLLVMALLNQSWHSLIRNTILGFAFHRETIDVSFLATLTSLMVFRN